MQSPAAQQRDSVASLVHEDLRSARELSAKIQDPWYRAQAYGWVARYASSDDWAYDMAKEGFEAAADCGDAFQQVCAAAWPIRALIERDLVAPALELLEISLGALPRIEQAASKAEAMLLVLQAAWNTGEEFRRSIAFTLAELKDEDDHWRVKRAFHDACDLLRSEDEEFVEKLGGGKGKELTPREFYW